MQTCAQVNLNGFLLYHRAEAEWCRGDKNSQGQLASWDVLRMASVWCWLVNAGRGLGPWPVCHSSLPLFLLGAHVRSSSLMALDLPQCHTAPSQPPAMVC
jgi:hypothetical protein